MRILVLEDEFLIALDVEHVCREHGAADVVIISTLDALGVDPFAREAFHAAVLDLMLAGKPTTGFAGQLLERTIPFVFATGYTESGGVIEGFEGVPVVGKPYSGHDLVGALGNAIARIKARQAGVEPITCADIASGP